MSSEMRVGSMSFTETNITVRKPRMTLKQIYFSVV